MSALAILTNSHCAAAAEAKVRSTQCGRLSRSGRADQTSEADRAESNREREDFSDA